jgi:dCTP deaminase
MAVLSKATILKRLNYPVNDKRSLVITPLLDTKSLDLDSVDLRLGSHFLLPRSIQQPFFCPDGDSATSQHVPMHVPFGEYLVVPAHQTVLDSTLEFIKMPLDVCGEVLTKSSVARTFTVVETAPWIHPGYRGCLTLEIANVSNTPVLLYPGRSICQLILMRVERPNMSALPSATYFGPVYPEAPKFDHPEVDLDKIGVLKDETWILVRTKATNRK